MNKDTLVVMLLDESASMNDNGKREAAISAFNEFVGDQSKIEGCYVTLYTFSTRPDKYREFFDAILRKAFEFKPAAIAQINANEYRPLGGTPLYDSMKQSIDEVGVKLASLPESDRPSKVIFVTLTDGEENTSKEFSLQNVLDTCEHQKKVYAWEFVFLMSGPESFAEIQKFQAVSNYSLSSDVSDASTIQAGYRNTSDYVTKSRTGS